MHPSFGHDQSQKPAHRIQQQMQLGAQAASGAPERLRASFLTLRPNVGVLGQRLDFPRSDGKRYLKAVLPIRIGFPRASHWQ